MGWRRIRGRDDSPPQSEGSGQGEDQWLAGSVVFGSVAMVSGVQGDITISEQARPLYFVDAHVPIADQQPSVSQARQQPSRLLHPRYELVRFVGRTEELNRLAAWRDSIEATSVLLVHGPGGQGKSRLAMQFARASQQTEWEVLQAHHVDDPAVAIRPNAASLQQGGRAATGRSVLLVVDYAERWPVSHLLELVASGARQGRRTRVLLLARPTGRWWQYLAHCIDRHEISSEEFGLRPLGEQINRRELFSAARDHFSKALDAPAARHLSPPSSLEKADFHSVLAVHMAALAAVDAHHLGNQPPENPARISAYLLNREIVYWQALHTGTNYSVFTRPEVMGRAVFTATLTRPLAHVEGIRVLQRVNIADTAEGASQILDDHAYCYPAADPNTILEPLYPDQLGEDFLALSIPGHPHISAFTPDPWAGGAIAHLLAPAEENPSPTWARPVMAVLIETACRWRHVAKGQLYPLLLAHPELVREVGSAALIRLVDLPDVPPDVLERIHAHLPRDHIDLAAGAAAVKARLESPGGEPVSESYDSIDSEPEAGPTSLPASAITLIATAFWRVRLKSSVAAWRALSPEWRTERQLRGV